MAYKETKSFRPTINKLINLAEYKNCNFISFDINDFVMRVGYYDEIEYSTGMHFPPLEMYFIYSKLNNIRFDLFCHRLKSKSLIIVELNFWSNQGNIFLLNDEVDSEKGKWILKEFKEVVDKVYDKFISGKLVF